MPNFPLILALAICTTAHYVIAMVMSLHARHQVKYLSIAWIMGIFAVALNVSLVLAMLNPALPAASHPSILLVLVSFSFLQSIYPLSIPMPAYLQWERMWRYAVPAIVLITVYGGAMLLGICPAYYGPGNAAPDSLQTVDILLRFASIVLRLYYVHHMVRLPQRLTHAYIPKYIKAYSTLVGINAIFFAILTFLPYRPALLITTIAIFTALNLYLCFRTLETMALAYPKPQIMEVEVEPEPAEIEEVANDFNEANQRRFERVEHWMQHNTERWCDNTFGRDLLCRETGLNRHLLLQCVRSAGYYNVHRYINSYRVKHVKQLIVSGRATNLTECLTAGFGAIKTLRTSFQIEETISIDEFLATHVPGRQAKS